MTAITRRRLILGTAATGALMLVHPYKALAEAGQVHLRLLATTDLHCHVHAYDYYADRAVHTLGLARTASLIAALRAEAANTLTFDNGDYLQGNPMGDYIAYEKGMAEGDIHPVIAGMQAVGYDAGTLGNHEFNYGTAFLHKVNGPAGFPFVCANVATELGASPFEDQLIAPAYVILEREVTDGSGAKHALKVGVIGFLPPQILLWDRAHLDGSHHVRDILEAARAYIPKIRAEGADLVVALAHTGIDTSPETRWMENAGFHLAGVAGIDALILGHQHKLWPAKDFEGDGLNVAAGHIQGIPAVMAGFWGSHLGMIDLLLERTGQGWRVVSGQSALYPISERQEDRSIKALVEDFAPAIAATATAHQQTLDYVRAEVGRTDAALQSYFALVADDPSVQIVNMAQSWYAAQLLKGTPHEGLPLVSAAAPFKAGGRGGADYYTDVAAGPIAIKNVADLYLYPNTLQLVRITGEQLKDWLERAAGAFQQIQPGVADQVLLNPDFPSYNYDVIDGVSYRIDLSQPSKFDAKGIVGPVPGSRIVDLSYQGKPVAPAQEFVVATNNYRASGGGNFPGADGSTLILEAPDTNRDILVRYIVAHKVIAPAADGNWTFAPINGASALFETSPRGRDYLAEVQKRGLRIEAAGEGRDGFAAYRISF